MTLEDLRQGPTEVVLKEGIAKVGQFVRAVNDDPTRVIYAGDSRKINRIVIDGGVTKIELEGTGGAIFNPQDFEIVTKE